jgi:hypothetical protein
MEETSNEDSEDQRKTNIIGINQIIISKETLVNLIS